MIRERINTRMDDLDRTLATLIAQQAADDGTHTHSRAMFTASMEVVKAAIGLARAYQDAYTMALRELREQAATRKAGDL